MASGQQRITVLGSSGLVGTAIARELAGRPVNLRLVGRRPTAVPDGARATIEVRRTDLTAPGAVAEAVEDSDAVIHLVAHMDGAETWRSAATNPRAERVNLGLVHDIIDAVRARRPRRPPIVLLAGSMSQVGRSDTARIDGSCPDNPLTSYDRQKLAAERALEAATADGLVRGSTLRLATLYSQGTDSPALDRGVVASMMRRAFAGHPLTVWNDGSAKRDLLCVDDAARAFVAALDQPQSVAGRHWLVGTGIATTVAELFHMIAKSVSVHAGGDPVPVTSVPPADFSLPTDQLDFVLDPMAYQRATGWLAAVPLADGLDNHAAAIVRSAGVAGEVVTP